MKSIPFQPKEPTFSEKALSDNFGAGKRIFVGSSFDIFSESVPEAWIAETIRKCRNNPENSYLFQTKNPGRMIYFALAFPIQAEVMLGVTLESNRNYPVSDAPKIQDRVTAMEVLREEYGFHVMVSVEPVLDFDVNEFADMIGGIRPDFVSIGADSKGHGLIEPPWDKIRELISLLEIFTEVKQKDNLSRLKKTQC
jgi:DNA repair photolyase